jgi:beta-lactamase superfamily II metal-dependent hydrolase
MGAAKLLPIVIVILAVTAMSTAGVIATRMAEAPSPSPQSAPTLSMTAIDVGHGDALLITYPNGQHVLVDGGTGYAARAFVIPYLVQHNITHLDAIVCTHEDVDHLGGLVEVLKDGRLTVSSAYDTDFPMLRNVHRSDQPQRDSIDEYRALLANNGVPHVVVKAGDELAIGRDSRDTQRDAETRVISPNAGLTKRLSQLVTDRGGDINQEPINENSVVLRIQYNNVSYLLTADTGRSGENDAFWSIIHDAQESQYLHADVLKLPQHGMIKPDDQFYSLVRPSYVIMSWGPMMLTEKPACQGLGEGVQNFDYFKKEFKLSILSTCDLGNLKVSTDGNGIHVQSESSSVPKTCCCSCAAGSTKSPFQIYLPFNRG